MCNIQTRFIFVGEVSFNDDLGGSAVRNVDARWGDPGFDSAQVNVGTLVLIVQGSF